MKHKTMVITIIFLKNLEPNTFFKLTVPKIPAYSGKMLGGVCGSNDGILENDFMTPEGHIFPSTTMQYVGPWGTSENEVGIGNIDNAEEFLWHWYEDSRPE